MEYELLGWPADGPTLDLDHREFAYAGKFVMSATGKAVARDDGVVAAVAFSEDRTDPDTARLRYITVRADRRGEGVGPRLAAFATDRLREHYAAVRIAVNNPFAYHALHKAGFGDTGETTGIAERVLASPPPPDADYETGLAWYLDRDLTDPERSFVAEKRATGPPERVEVPEGNG
ncbi:MAG: GNAT family N-acetyltransferase [Halobacteriaceae archaeon]